LRKLSVYIFLSGKCSLIDCTFIIRLLYINDQYFKSRNTSGTINFLFRVLIIISIFNLKPKFGIQESDKKKLISFSFITITNYVIEEQKMVEVYF
jgi:hypothetical protein